MWGYLNRKNRDEMSVEKSKSTSSGVVSTSVEDSWNTSIINKAGVNNCTYHTTNIKIDVSSSTSITEDQIQFISNLVENQKKCISNATSTPAIKKQDEQIKLIPNAKEMPILEAQKNQKKFFQNVKIMPAIKKQVDQKKMIPTIEDQNYLKKEKILELIWKYLPKETKFNCTLVCKRFDNFIVQMDYFSLHIKTLESDQLTTQLTRLYKTVVIEVKTFWHDDFLAMMEFLKPLKLSTIELNFNNIHTDMSSFCKLLAYFPLLESIKCVHILLSGEFELKYYDFPQFSNLTNLKIETAAIKLQLMHFFEFAQNIQTLSLKGSVLEIGDFNKFIQRHKNSLKSLTINNCTKIADSNCDLSNFDCLLQLRELYIINGYNLTMKVLNSNCMNWLTDFKVVYSDREKENVGSFLQSYFKFKDINEYQLSKYDADECNEPIITKTKCTNTENFITTFYNFHHCKSKKRYCYKHDYKKCIPISLIDLKLNEEENLYGMKLDFFLSIEVTQNTTELLVLDKIK